MFTLGFFTTLAAMLKLISIPATFVFLILSLSD